MIELLMIHRENCYYCVQSKPLIEKFAINNQKNIKVKFIDYKDYKNQFGQFQSVPVFILKKNEKEYINFDFYDEVHEKRTYSKLVSTLNKLVNSRN